MDRENENKRELEEWNKKKRLEKIRNLQKIWLEKRKIEKNTSQGINIDSTVSTDEQGENVHNSTVPTEQGDHSSHGRDDPDLQCRGDEVHRAVIAKYISSSAVLTDERDNPVLQCRGDEIHRAVAEEYISSNTVPTDERDNPVHQGGGDEVHGAVLAADNISSTEDNIPSPVHNYQDQVGACQELTNREMIHSPRTSKKWTTWRRQNEDNIALKDDLNTNDTTLEKENDAPAKINYNVKKLLKQPKIRAIQPTLKNKRKSIISENLQNKKIQSKPTVTVVQTPKRILILDNHQKTTNITKTSQDLIDERVENISNISNFAKLSNVKIEDNLNSEDDPLLKIDDYQIEDNTTSEDDPLHNIVRPGMGDKDNKTSTPTVRKFINLHPPTKSDNPTVREQRKDKNKKQEQKLNEMNKMNKITKYFTLQQKTTSAMIDNKDEHLVITNVNKEKECDNKNEKVIDSPGRSQSLDLKKVCASSEYNNPVFTYRPDLEKIKKLSLSKQLEKNSRPNDSKS